MSLDVRNNDYYTVVANDTIATRDTEESRFALAWSTHELPPHSIEEFGEDAEAMTRRMLEIAPATRWQLIDDE